MTNAIAVMERTTHRGQVVLYGSRHGNATGGSKMLNQSMLVGLLDPKSSSLSLAALAQAAASSGKRLVVEIRDETPVKIVRTLTRGM
jgi:hypothetical protein